MIEVDSKKLFPKQIAFIFAECFRVGKQIQPCNGQKVFDDRSFTIDKNRVYLWYNTPDNSSHIAQM